jgi:hypothetical protein
MLGGDYVKTFWASNWYLAAVFWLVFLILNAYFALNRKLFSLLEAENWQEVRSYLENRVYSRNRLSRRTLTILINTYIVLSDMAGLRKLSRYLEEKKSRFFPFFGLELGVPYLVRDDAAGRLAYFEGLLGNPKARKKDWIRWNIAFSRMAADERERARDELADLTRNLRDPVPLLLSAYLLEGCGGTDAAVKTLAEDTRAALREKYPPRAWNRLVERPRNDLMILVFSKLLDEARNWLFEETTLSKV